MTATDTSLYLSGNYAPVTEEVTAFDLPVIGELPAELDGRYLRNGPNPIGRGRPADPPLVRRRRHGARHPPRATGRAEWYRNRYVGSSAAQQRRRGEPDIPGPNWNG